MQWRKQQAALIHSATRGVAAAIGLFAVGNAVVGWWLAGTIFDQNIWWIDSRPLPYWLANPLIALAGGLLVAYAWRPGMGGWRRRFTRCGLAALLALSVWNTLTYWGLLALGTIASPFPFPLSLLVAVLLFGLWRGTGTAVGGTARNSSRWLRVGVGLMAFAAIPVLFPLAQMFFYGKTDYRRPADVAVVFGAAVWPGNRPSHALADRVNTGIALYQEGLVKKLLFSGGPSDTDAILHEVVVMRQMALDAGIPDHDIIVDADGINSQATVANTIRLFAANEWTQVLAVSHFYHLPRIKMTYARAGFTVYTVPAEETHVLLKLPFYLAREVAALWFYYLRPLWEGTLTSPIST